MPSNRRIPKSRIYLRPQALIIALFSLIILTAGGALAQVTKPPLPPPPAPPGLVVCLDPGHPSEVNSGKSVTNGVTELDMNWQVTLRVADLLAKMPGVRVVKTREVKDKLTTNRERAEIANRAGAALLLRLHCDSGKGSGFTLYYPDQQGKKGGFVGPPATVINASRQAAQAIYTGMAKVLAGYLKDNGIRGDSATAIGKKQGALTGSIFSQVPVVTVEMVFLNNKADAVFIKSPEGQERLALALAQGVMLYLKSLPQKRPAP